MAAAATGPVFASETNLEAKEDSSGVISETGIILGAEDIEEFIVVEIEKIHSRNQRANTKAVCKALAKSHGLTEQVVSLQLKRMILTGRIEKRLIRGSESFKLSTEVILHGNKLARKVSNDEDKAAEYRNDLVQTSTRQEGAKAEGMEQADNSDEYGSDAESSHGESEAEGSHGESEAESSQDESEADSGELLITKGSDLMDRMETMGTKYDAVVVDKDCQVNNMGESDMNHRLSILEQKVEALTAKIPTGQEGNKKFQIMLEKIGSLERENRGLKDENNLLKNEIRNLKVIPNSTNSLQGLELSCQNENNTANEHAKINQSNTASKTQHEDHQTIHGERLLARSVPREKPSHQGSVIDRASPKGNDHQHPTVVRKRDGTAIATTKVTTRENFQDTYDRKQTTESNLLRRQRNVAPGEWSYAEAVQQQRAPLRPQENSKWGQNSAERFHARESHWPGKQHNNFGQATSFQGKVRPQGYREFIDQKPGVAIVGDSIVGSIKRRDINTETNDYFVTV